MLRLKYSSSRIEGFVNSLLKQVSNGLESRLVEVRDKAESLFHQYLSGSLDVNGRKIHVVTGRLLRGAFVELEKMNDKRFELRVGSTAPYAIYVFRGTWKMAPRPADLKVIEEILTWLARAF